MMANRTNWVISLAATQWQLHRVRGGKSEMVSQGSRESTGDAELANAVASQLTEAGYRSGQSVMLALGANLCVAANVQVPSARHGRNREAMTYLLEPMMPWSAENTVVDFERADGQALMIAARLDSLAEMLAAWEEHGIQVMSIVPESRLAIERHLRDSSARAGKHVVLMDSGHSVDFWMIDGRQPLEWQHLSQEETGIVGVVKMRLMSEAAPLTVICYGLANAVVEELRSINELDVHGVDSSLEDSSAAWAGCVERILDGHEVSPIELLRGPLLRSDRRAATSALTDWLLASVMVLLACLGVAFLMKANEANQKRELISEEQKTVFREVLPNQRVGQAIRSRLTSELKKLQGMSGQGADVPESVAAAEVLKRLLKALPNEMRFQILEIRIEDGRLALDGHVRSHSSADTIAAALRKAGATVASPQSNRLATGERGVGFRISAELTSPVDTGGSSS